MQRRTANEVALTVPKGTEEWLKAQRTRPGGGKPRCCPEQRARQLRHCPLGGGYSSSEVLCAKS